MGDPVATACARGSPSARRGWRRALCRAAAAPACAAAALLAAAAPAQPRAAAGSPDDIVARAAELVRGADVAYVSEYVSFAGADSIGRVAFALDTNRGRDGREHQAEHFVVMYDELTGWVDVAGYTEFPNRDAALLEWPDSAYFELAGSPYALESLVSAPNGLTLELDALEPRVTSAAESTLLSMGSAPGTLRWNDRTIEGRVIYEYLAMRGANRLAGGVGGVLGMITDGPDFQGLYLTAGDGELYVHRAPGAAAAETGNPLMAFWTRGGRQRRVDDIAFHVADHDAALGFYRWPAAWNVAWTGDCGNARLEVASLDRDTQTNWILGGFAIGFVEGTLTCGRDVIPVYGLAELIR